MENVSTRYSLQRSIYEKVSTNLITIGLHPKLPPTIRIARISSNDPLLHITS